MLPLAPIQIGRRFELRVSSVRDAEPRHLAHRGTERVRCPAADFAAIARPVLAADPALERRLRALLAEQEPCRASSALSTDAMLQRIGRLVETGRLELHRIELGVRLGLRDVVVEETADPLAARDEPWVTPSSSAAFAELPAPVAADAPAGASAAVAAGAPVAAAALAMLATPPVTTQGQCMLDAARSGAAFVTLAA